MPVWNPWHGCHKLSEGCRNCYVYRTDGRYGRDSAEVTRNASFNYPLERTKDGSFRLMTDETVFCCLSSDFFVPDADEWRPELWSIIKTRCDLNFHIITKRIDRFLVGLPEDWGSGYPNVHISCTVENQDRADYRLPIFLSMPIAGKSIVCEPLLSDINLSQYLTPEIELLVVGGESGENARICDYSWVLSLREQCLKSGNGFYFKQTGARFLKDGKLYQIPRRLQHSQARRANIDLAYSAK